VELGNIVAIALEGDGIPDVVDGNAAEQMPFLDDQVGVEVVVLVEWVAIVHTSSAYKH